MPSPSLEEYQRRNRMSDPAPIKAPASHRWASARDGFFLAAALAVGLFSMFIIF